MCESQCSGLGSMMKGVCGIFVILFSTAVWGKCVLLAKIKPAVLSTTLGKKFFLIVSCQYKMKLSMECFCTAWNMSTGPKDLIQIINTGHTQWQ